MKQSELIYFLYRLIITYSRQTTADLQQTLGFRLSQGGGTRNLLFFRRFGVSFLRSAVLFGGKISIISRVNELSKTFQFSGNFSEPAVQSFFRRCGAQFDKNRAISIKIR